MARMRTVKPELRSSEVVAAWPFEVRYFFVLLWGYLDDKGRGLDVPKTIAGDCFPHDDKVSANTVTKWLDLMAATRTAADKEPPICRYEANGRRYLHCVNWPEHQRPNRPTPSRMPPCPLHEGLTESSSEPPREPDTEPPLSASESDSVPVVRGFDSRELEHTPAPAEPARERPPAADPPDFGRFWDAYPRRVGKGAARKAWSKAIRGDTTADVVITAAEAFAERCQRERTEERFIAHPATWLNAERWTDQPTTVATAASTPDDWWSN